jgi:hypothetical protein
MRCLASKEVFMARAKIALFGLTLLVAAPTFAADNGFYLGAAIGQGYVKASDVQNFSVNDFNANATGYKIMAGYRALDILAIEANYFDLGSASDTVAGTSVKADTTGIDAFAMLYLPIPIVDVFAKVGVVNWDQKVSVSSLGSGSDSGNDLAYGIGVGAAFSHAAVRLEYERFEIPNTDSVDMLSLGFTWTF